MSIFHNTKQPKIAFKIDRPCKGTTNEQTWFRWMEQYPNAEFFTKEIGARVYFMVSEKEKIINT